MNAIQFIKEHGVDKAREVVVGIPSKCMSCYYSTLCYCTKSNKYSDRFAPRESLVNMGWLKRIVESVDLVKRYGGIAEAKTIHNDEFWCEIAFERLEQAIADYKQIILETNNDK